MAAVNSMADAFGQAATQAPQPMHAAASKAASASGLGTRMRCASGAAPVGAVMKPPDCDDAVERAAVDDEVLDHREGRGAPRLDVDLVAVLEVAHVELARGGRPLGPVGDAVDDHAAHAADALAAVVVEGDGLLARRGSACR